jgi:hypothetical protein
MLFYIFEGWSEAHILLIELLKSILKFIFHIWERDSASVFLGIYNSKLDNSVCGSFKENSEYILGDSLAFVKLCSECSIPIVQLSTRTRFGETISLKNSRDI